jgi:hypothetical protein
MDILLTVYYLIFGIMFFVLPPLNYREMLPPMIRLIIMTIHCSILATCLITAIFFIQEFNVQLIIGSCVSFVGILVSMVNEREN